MTISARSAAAWIVVMAAACPLPAAPVLAQSAVHAPGARIDHPADFNGIWKLVGPNGLRQTPPYNPEWAKRFADVQARLKAGLPVRDDAANCLPPGMPRTLLFPYPVEILMTPGQVTMLTEYANEVRRVFTDGRKHPGPDEIEPTFRGHSIGRWEGKTLVVDTVGMRPDTVFSNSLAPHSDKLHVVERITMVNPDELRWEVTLDDSVAFTRPETFTLKLQRAAADDEIREYVCLESQRDDTRSFDKIP